MANVSRLFIRRLAALLAVPLTAPFLLGQKANGLGQTANVISPVRPLQTELIAPLDITHVHIGSPVLVRVDLQWAETGCTMKAGSIVQGHVVGIVRRSKGVRDSEMQLSFKAADCEAHHEAQFPFTLVALIGPAGGSVGTGQSGVSEAPPLADAIGNAIGGPGGIRSARSASAINSAFAVPARNLPTQIFPGHVIDIRKTVLSVGAGAGGATIVTALGHDLRLEQGTSLILTHPVLSASEKATAKLSSPEQKAFSMSGTGGVGSELVSTGTGKVNVPVAAPAEMAIPETPDESDICSGTCNVVGGSKPESEVTGSSAIASLSLKRLGYSPRENRELSNFDNETTLTFLDASNLLCTFDPHRLRERSGLGEEAVRNIRAVLVDPQTHTIKRVMEWRVRGNEQYLWRLSQGRVLVHMGHELRLFDAELKPVRIIRIDGPVAWVVSSASGNHIAVGTVRERHSAAVHQDLEAVLSSEPEEDVDVRVFDEDFAVVISAVQSSKMPSPVLSEAGELRLHGDGHTHWKITEYRWDRTEQTIASMKSACRPSLSTPERDLIFAVGCTTSGGRWFRMLRRDGHPLLKGVSPSDEIQQSAQAAIDGAFAVRIVKTVRAMNYGQPFKRTDLVGQKISIYRSSDGRGLATVNTADFALSQMAFALSPSGNQLALVGTNAIVFYAMNLPHN